MNKTLEELKQERKNIGDIIDDRSLNGIPKFAYVLEYEKLTRQINLLENNQQRLGGL